MRDFDLRDLDAFVAVARTRNFRRAALESRVSDLVNSAYGLTPDEIDLMWQTAPPRMPIARG